MPWSVGDVDKHKKGLSPEQKKEWVKVANGVYDDCIKNGGDDKSCAPKAIRIANSKFSAGEEEVTVPSNALMFADSGKVSFQQGEDDKIRTLEMVGYTGNIIPKHWFWGNLGIDLSGVSFPKDKYPILRDHDTNRPIAFSGKPEVSDQKGIFFPSGGMTILSTPDAESFFSLSKQGFPFEASVRVTPTALEYVEPGETALVNGRELKGPGTIFRKAIFKECSVCVFGADSGTKSTAFGEESLTLFIEGSIKTKKEEEAMPFDAEKFKDDKDFQQYVEGRLKESTDSLNKKLGEVEAQLVQKTQEKEQLTKSQTEMETRLRELEKADVLRKEKDLRASADAIFSETAKKMEFPDNLQSKARQHVSHTSFTKDGILDVESFRKACETELADWKKSLGDITPKILGSTSLSTSVVSEDAKLSEEDDATVARLMGHLNIKDAGASGGKK